MKNIYKIALGIFIVGLVVVALFAFDKKAEIGAYNNQFDGYVVEKILTSSDISTSTATAITQYATGDFYIDNIIVSTDSTGLATGTNFQIAIDGNDYGTSTVLSHAVSSLGANATVDLNSATTKQRAILEDGSRLVAYCTTANCEGDGKAKITVILKKASWGSAIFD